MKGSARHLPAALVGLALGVLAIGPGLMPGYVLSYDMVFVPEPRFTPMTFGVTGTLPRNVPSDAFVTALSTVLPGDVAQKSILLSIFVMACVSAGSLVPTDHMLPRLVAGVCYAWNPFVAERLLIGQWALLLGYAALPWVVSAAARVAGRGGGWRLTCALAPAAIGGFAAMAISGGTALIVAAVAPPEAGGSRLRARAAALLRTAGVLLVLALPWLVTGWFRPAGVPADETGVDAFAARADTPFGAVGSLLLLGGAWNRETVPPGYGAAVSATVWLLVVLAALACYALWARTSSDRTPWARGLAAAGAAGLVLAALGAVAPGPLKVLIRLWPGFAVLRDGQQYVAPLAVVIAVGLALPVAGVVGRLRPHGPSEALGSPRPSGLLGGFLVALPLVLLPSLAWGAGGRLQAVDYPDEWRRAREIITSDRVPGDVVVLPWSQHRSRSWNRGRTVLDPWPRLLTRRVIVNDAVRVGTMTIPAEDPKARRIDGVLRSAGPITGALRGAGVRYVVLDAEAGDARTAGRLAGAERVLDRPGLVIFRIANPQVTPERATPVWAVWVAWAVAVGTLGIAAFVCSIRVSGSTLFTPSPLARSSSRRAP